MALPFEISGSSALAASRRTPQACLSGTGHALIHNALAAVTTNNAHSTASFFDIAQLLVGSIVAVEVLTLPGCLNREHGCIYLSIPSASISLQLVAPDVHKRCMALSLVLGICKCNIHLQLADVNVLTMIELQHC